METDARELWDLKPGAWMPASRERGGGEQRGGRAPSHGRANSGRQGGEEEFVRRTEKGQPGSRTRAHRVGTREPREEEISARRTSFFRWR